MKRLINMLLSMIYPALISLFTYCFVAAFTKGEVYDVVGVLTVILAIVFSLMFVAGLVWNIIYSIKHKDE